MSGSRRVATAFLIIKLQRQWFVECSDLTLLAADAVIDADLVELKPRYSRCCGR